jgi:glutamate 5-kinase
VFAADVDGLYTANPKRSPNARLLESVTPDDLTRISFSSASRIDVTGSIEGKVRRMFEIARLAGETLIVNGNVKSRVRDALRGRPVVGTRVAGGA